MGMREGIYEYGRNKGFSVSHPFCNEAYLLVWQFLSRININIQKNVDRPHTAKYNNKTIPDDGSDLPRPPPKFLHIILFLALLPIILQSELLLHRTISSTKPIQIIVTAFIFVMVLILLWQTFPLRYGLLSILVKEFKYTFLVLVAFLGMEFWSIFSTYGVGKRNKT